MRMKKLLMMKLLLANLFLAGFISQNAYADQIRIPATVCQIWGGSSAYVDDLGYSKNGRIVNKHPSVRIGVVCPVPLHNTQAVEQVRVFYTDSNALNNNTGKFSCRLRSNNAYGTKQNDTQVRNTGLGVTNPGAEWIFQNVNAQSQNYEYQVNNLTLLCFIPPEYNDNTSSLGSIVIDYSEVPGLY